MAYLSVPKIFRHLTFLHLSSPFIVDNCSHISNLSFAITYIHYVFILLIYQIIVNTQLSTPQLYNTQQFIPRFKMICFPKYAISSHLFL